MLTQNFSIILCYKNIIILCLDLTDDFAMFINLKIIMHAYIIIVT